METPKGERFSDIRLEQAVGVGAEVLVTACPYCISNFEDSALNWENGNPTQIKDITEIVAEVMVPSGDVSKDVPRLSSGG